MKLTSDIHVVGGGYYGFSISGRLDCHVYVINSGTELAIVDPGCGIDRDFQKIISNIRDDGLDPKKIKKECEAELKKRKSEKTEGETK